MKTYTGCIESQISNLIEEAFEFVVGTTQAKNALKELKGHLSINVSLNTVEISIFCDYFTASFLAKRLAKEGFNSKGYDTDIERVSFVRNI